MSLPSCRRCQLGRMNHLLYKQLSVSLSICRLFPFWFPFGINVIVVSCTLKKESGWWTDYSGSIICLCMNRSSQTVPLDKDGHSVYKSTLITAGGRTKTDTIWWNNGMWLNLINYLHFTHEERALCFHFLRRNQRRRVIKPNDIIIIYGKYSID